MNYSLSSLKGLYRGLYEVEGLRSKLLKGGYIGDFLGGILGLLGGML